MTHKIYVVEDDQPILELMEILLRRLGYEPVLMPNGLDALEAIRKDPPALILLDIMMTPVNGWEILDRIRSEFGMKDLPVIIFSASPAVEDRMLRMQDPHLGVLHKPVTFAELRDGIGKYLS